MSQAGSNSVQSSPSVATTYVTDSGNAVPVANILNVITEGAGTDGIQTTGAGNTITIHLSNLSVGTATTSDALGQVQPLNVDITVPNNGAVSVRANLVGFDAANSISTSGELLAGAQNIAGVVTIVGADTTESSSPALVGVSWTLVVSGTDVHVQVTGIAGHTINWKAILEIISVT